MDIYCSTCQKRYTSFQYVTHRCDRLFQPELLTTQPSQVCYAQSPGDTGTSDSSFIAYDIEDLSEPEEDIIDAPGLDYEDIDRLCCFPATGLCSTCSICLIDIYAEEEVIKLPCQHEFHRAWIEPWLLNCGSCPNDRSSVRDYL